jgi:hypothetical protein
MSWMRERSEWVWLEGGFVTRFSRFLVAASTLIWFHPSAVAAAILRVCPTGCTYATIQSAINAAQTGDTIAVSRGTYTENLLIYPPVAATTLTVIGAGANQTIVNGNQQDCVLQIDKGYTVSISGLTFTNGECLPAGGILTDGTLTLKNVTVTQNLGDEASGGIANDIDGVLTVSNSTLSDNTALSQSSGMGGGFLNFGTASLIDTTVSGNTAPTKGGGIENEGSLRVSNCSVINNTTQVLGGGLDNRNSGLGTGPATITISNSTIDNNTAFTGGGFFNSSGVMTVTRSMITENTAGEGGGLENSVQGTTTLINTRVSRNTASTDAGGVANDRGTLTLKDSPVTNNAAVSSSGAKGGGLGIFGGTVELKRSPVTNNSASGPIGGLGGGIVITDDGTVTLKQSPVVANNASTGGGGIYSFTGTANFTASPVRGNQPDNCVNVPGC